MFKYTEKYKTENQKEYYSCNWIEHGMVFFPFKQTMCCLCGSEGSGNTMLRNNYNGESINWDRLFWLKNKFKEFHKKGKIHENCINCPFLEKKEWSEPENYINNLYISHWTQCNSKCVYCYATQHPDDFKHHKAYNLLPIIKEMLDKNILRKGGSIHFGGGEPTLLDEFEDLINLLLDNKFYNLRIHTSGIKYSPALERGIREGRLGVVVSTDAGFSKTYEKIKQVPCFDKVRENIAKYSKAQSDVAHEVAPGVKMLGSLMVGSKFIIMPGINDTKKEVDAWLNANKKAGLHTTIIDIEENWFQQNKDAIPQRVYDLIDYIEMRSKKLKTNFELYERIQQMEGERPESTKNIKKSFIEKIKSFFSI